ncbi:amino acid ABC transporter ATP-binding/permease protein [Novosphingobium mangrovi (ex Huang et al. 2023)]|uniref:ATP-binding cassette domain-containing protein n=1 Tax=Novosphingobium mangrovi (ex Huang et al. 2023) TaxID=2976432 RepID=A0ABT2I572_9SPHN|nr:ATP-binding cassette domain-containing protein [Novosphingobium mangrovi (ex Huang et al. 2023)]MCT2399956.1 ATP-binding cassette domain-containing protein [Novosphingobium mangrovi (ex Huang et al. 2023)]
MIAQLLHDASRRQRRATWVAILLAMLAAVAGVGLLAVSGWFLTGAAIAGASGIAAARGFNYLLPSAGIRAFAVIRTLGRYGERLFSHRAAFFALADVRPALFARLAAAEPGMVFSRPSGEVAAQLGSDVDALEDAVVRRVTLPGALAGAATGLVAGILAGPWSAVALLVGLAAMRLASRGLSARLVTAHVQRRADAMTRLKAGYAEYAACGAEIAVYRLVPRIVDAMAADVDDLEAARLAIVRHEAVVQGAQMVLAAFTVAAVLALANGGAPLAAAAALAGAAAAEAWSGLVRTDMQRPRVDDAMERLEDMASLQPRPPHHDDIVRLAAEPVSFSSGEREVVLEPAGRLLIGGPSGAGKSRLLGTLLGLREDAPQRIHVGTIEVRELGLESLRRLFASAPQDAALIAGTVADNLRLARPGVTDAEIWDALETACLAETVRALPQGLDQWLGGDGARLSGGQRKRLSLARALLAGRPWLVLDEPSEGLDSATERQLAANLSAWLDRTGTGLILVSHREGLRGLAASTFAL